MSFCEKYFLPLPVSLHLSFAPQNIFTSGVAFLKQMGQLVELTCVKCRKDLVNMQRTALFVIIGTLSGK